MNITNLPFNRFLGIEEATGRADDCLALPDDHNYTNHVGTVHAGALFALAEASSGFFLISETQIHPDSATAVVRNSEIKYRQPAKGRIVSRCSCEEGSVDKLRSDLESRGRARITVNVELMDRDSVVVAKADFHWFIATDVPRWVESSE